MRHPKVRGVLVGYHTRNVVMDITERRCDILGSVKRCSHYDCFWITIRDTTGS